MRILAKLRELSEENKYGKTDTVIVVSRLLIGFAMHQIIG